MSEPVPPGPPRSHRASTRARGAALRLAAPLTAVAVVVIVIALLIWINGRSDDSSDSAGGPPSPQPTTAGAVTPSATPSNHHRPKPRPTRSPSPRVTPTPHRSTHHTAAPSSSPAPVVFSPVEVLNNSRIKGLAHHVAAEVQSRGWTISQVGNLRGRVAESTLYFPPGELAAAQHLAGEFGSVQRVLPQSEGGLHSSSLVLVVTRFWTD
jgi:cytoskeletal protein RodZ